MQQLSKLILGFLLVPSYLLAQEKVDLDIVNQIKKEETTHSQIPYIAHYLTDVSGPRLTNSPGYNRAADWAVSEFKKWGLSNAAKEPWGEFGKGWEIERCNISLSAPYYHPLIAFPYGWSIGTNGNVSAPVVSVSMDQDPSEEQIRGKIVLVADTVKTIRQAFDADAHRYTEEELKTLNNHYWITREQLIPLLTLRQKIKAFEDVLAKKGAVAILYNDRQGKDGSVHADKREPFSKDYKPTIPKIIVSAEDYLRISRLMESKLPVKMDIDVETKFFTDDTKGYNVVAEIPGTDPKLKDEVVMIGGHLDSWYAGTGATDNAAGCIVMMETMRLIKALNIKPRRTVRIALWGGEEQGLLGSINYVKAHFGDPESKQLKPEQSKVSAYYNLDNGTGKIRGIFLQNNEKVKPIFEQWLRPFAEEGATSLNPTNTGATDHYSFDLVGIPGFQFIQDPLEYETRTHHTNMDTYDHLSIDDLKQAAMVVTSFVYHTAMRDEKLPRKPVGKPEQWLFTGF